MPNIVPLQEGIEYVQLDDASNVIAVMGPSGKLLRIDANAGTLPANAVLLATDGGGNVTGLTSSGGQGALMGTLTSGQWFTPPSVFRLLMNGTGNVTLDSRDAAGSVTANVFSATLTGAVNQIGFPYAGDAATAIRATLTGSATARVL